MCKVIQVNFNLGMKGDEEMKISTIAKFFTSKIETTPKKLQKLCYYAYVWYWNFYKKDLFENKFEAWPHGPVDPDLYREYKKYGYKLIEKSGEINIENNLEEFLNFIIYQYGDLSAGQLEDLTHMEEPWKKARKGLLSFQASNRKIETKEISNYYLKRYGDIRKKSVNFENILRGMEC